MAYFYTAETPPRRIAEVIAYRPLKTPYHSWTRRIHQRVRLRQPGIDRLIPLIRPLSSIPYPTN